MSLIAIVNFAERLLNQAPGRDSQGQSSSKSAKVKEGQDGVDTQDQFTPSEATGQGLATAATA
jgi:hypothetical protein